MPRSPAKRSRSSCISAPFSVWNTFTAPPFKLKERSGTARSRSTSITRPKPRHSPHAEAGWLNENVEGVASSTRMPQGPHTNPSECVSDTPPDRTRNVPFPSLKPLSQASRKRAAASSELTRIRSKTTNTSRSPTGSSTQLSASSHRKGCPPISTRENPWRPMKPRTSGKVVSLGNGISTRTSTAALSLTPVGAYREQTLSIVTHPTFSPHSGQCGTARRERNIFK